MYIQFDQGINLVNVRTPDLEGGGGGGRAPKAVGPPKKNWIFTSLALG